jgi:hypothetical protein
MSVQNYSVQNCSPVQKIFVGVQSCYHRDSGVVLMSAKAELARRVMQIFALGESVSTLDALQLRNWALTPQGTMLPLEEIALRILIEKKRMPRSA